MITKIVIHCSDSPQGRGDTAETIHRWHKGRGFDGIGYHHVILDDGTIEPGRPEYWTGAHVRDYNTGSIGICLIGIDEFTTEQMAALQQLIEAKRREYPAARVMGHRDLDPSKTCPNFDAQVFNRANLPS